MKAVVIFVVLASLALNGLCSEEDQSSGGPMVKRSYISYPTSSYSSIAYPGPPKYIEQRAPAVAYTAPHPAEYPNKELQLLLFKYEESSSSSSHSSSESSSSDCSSSDSSSSEVCDSSAIDLGIVIKKCSHGHDSCSSSSSSSSCSSSSSSESSSSS